MKKNSSIKCAAALCLSFLCFLFSASAVKADYVEDTVNGVRYTNKVYITAGYARSSSYGGDSFVSVSLDDTTNRITNVRSNSKYLLAKKTYESIYTKTSSYTDDVHGTAVQTTETNYNSAYISFFGKKKGTYTVKFDVVDKNGVKKCTKKIKVYVGKQPSTTSSIKSITYAGKTLYEHRPFTKTTSGKLKVKLNKGYSLVSIHVKKLNNTGKWYYKKVKNGKKISLAKTQKYKYEQESCYEDIDSLFPKTVIEITVKNKKTKEKLVEIFELYTMNAK